MAYPFTDTGYNMYDMLSMIQKSIRRGDYNNAGFSAFQLRNSYRSLMWKRLLVISAEDCYGVVTKEIFKLKELDDSKQDDKYLGCAVALLCKNVKSRDACYFACNFILDSRNPVDVIAHPQAKVELQKRLIKNTKSVEEYDQFGFNQVSLFSNENPEPEIDKKFEIGAVIQLAVDHRDMDAIGYYSDLIRNAERDFLWDVLEDYAVEYCKKSVIKEIIGLRKSDTFVNNKKKEKDEIFISKALILLCHSNEEKFGSIQGCEMVDLHHFIDWDSYNIKDIKDCDLKNGVIPEWVYDCHTLKGKKMGKTDWDMTRTEQEALFPLKECYFDNASWIYTYEQDYRNGSIDDKGIAPIREYAKTHETNPVKIIPY